MKRFGKRALSLVEVLVATGILAVAVYGLVLSTTAQTMAEVQSRQEQFIKALHNQWVREILNGERVPMDTNNGNATFSNNRNEASTPTNVTVAFSGATVITNTALPGLTVQYRDRWTLSSLTLESEMAWRTLGGNYRLSKISVIYQR